MDPQDPGLHSLCSSWHSCLPSFNKDGLFPSALCSSALLTQSRTFSTFLLWTSSKNLRTTLPRLRQQLNFAATFFSIGHFSRCNQMLDQRKFRKDWLCLTKHGVVCPGDKIGAWNCWPRCFYTRDRVDESWCFFVFSLAVDVNLLSSGDLSQIIHHSTLRN